MDFTDAVKWVDEHADVILAKAKNHCYFTPYEPIDYLQTGYEAAILSVLKCFDDSNLVYESLFWETFYTMLRELTPTASRRAVASILSNPVITPDDVPVVSDKYLSDETVMEIFEACSQFLTEKQTNVTRRYLGLDNGVDSLSIPEIAKQLSCCHKSVQRVISRGLRRIREGSTKDFQLRIAQIIESNVTYGFEAYTGIS